MSLTVWVILGVLALFCVALVLGCAKLEKMQARREWLHPPEDDDGISILKDDDPDGDCTR